MDSIAAQPQGHSIGCQHLEQDKYCTPYANDFLCNGEGMLFALYYYYFVFFIFWNFAPQRILCLGQLTLWFPTHWAILMLFSYY